MLDSMVESMVVMSLIRFTAIGLAPVVITSYSRVHQAGADYIVGNQYLVKGIGDAEAKIGELHHITLVHGTSELYFHLRMYDSMIRHWDSGLPYVELGSLQNNLTVFAYHRLASMEVAVVHRHASDYQKALIVKF